MSVFRKEFVRVEVFACCFSSGHEETMVGEETAGVRESENTVEEHGEGYSLL